MRAPLPGLYAPEWNHKGEDETKSEPDSSHGTPLNSQQRGIRETRCRQSNVLVGRCQQGMLDLVLARRSPTAVFVENLLDGVTR